MVQPVPETSSFYAEVGRRVRVRRDELKMSQEHLAAQLGLKRTSVANLEAGQQRFSAETLMTLARALSLDPVDLLPPRAPRMDVDTMIPSTLPPKVRRWIAATVAKAPSEAVVSSS